ncbi:hypothetical protein [Kordiimonas aestuarii]|uniref:hypothetical protein n=1 Tax=Kordiimonas aestuarii TaxID=1005925 RepID=UPI0021D23009|nr:hypothetical protein [Kordiimonas aestuarii]
MSKTDDISPDQRRLEQYLDICNRVLAANRDRFPYNRIWEAGEAALKGRTVAIALVDDEPRASCVVKLKDHHIEAAETGGAAGDQPPVSRLSTRYIDDVLANPEKYIKDPSLIDWCWLKR